MQVVKAAVDVVQVLVVVNVEVVVVVRLINVKVVKVIELPAINRSCSILGATADVVQAETTNNKQTSSVFILGFSVFFNKRLLPSKPTSNVLRSKI